MPERYHGLGELLKQQREDAGLTLDALAERLGTTRQQLIRYEAGENRPRKYEPALARELAVPLAHLQALAIAESYLFDLRELIERAPEIEAQLTDLLGQLQSDPVPAARPAKRR